MQKYLLSHDITVAERWIDMAAHSLIWLYAGAGVVSLSAGLMAQIDASLWEKSAWVIMCSLFLTGLGILWRVNQKIIDNREKEYIEEIRWLREANSKLSNKIQGQDKP